MHELLSLVLNIQNYALSSGIGGCELYILDFIYTTSLYCCTNLVLRLKVNEWLSFT